MPYYNHHGNADVPIKPTTCPSGYIIYPDAGPRNGWCVKAQKNPPMVETEKHYLWTHRGDGPEGPTLIGPIFMLVLAFICLIICIIVCIKLIRNNYDEIDPDGFINPKLINMIMLGICGPATIGLGIGGYFVLVDKLNEQVENEKIANEVKNRPEPTPIMESTTINMDRIF